MSAPLSLTLSALATMLPFAAFLLIMVGVRRSARLSAGLSLAAVAVSLVCAVWLLLRHFQLEAPIQYTFRWMASGELQIVIGFMLDPLSLLMLTVVAAISFLVQVYSLGYMAGDEGFARYYAFMSLFAWAMMNLTLAPTLLQLYVFWELVGLSSYLLIGFWYQKFSASEAGKKAFVMTRLGDVAFFIGLLVVLLHLGNLNILELNRPAVADIMAPGVLTISALLIFGGIIGKSAQFPLLTWLPDAMEGPTPVSALLHSATMVAAGVYLFARLFPFFSLSETAMGICLAVGTVSMLLAATMAMVSRDIKQVWAYSTISQLGFMIMGLAGGAYFAGVFHLTTHAAFKALLFLCSGVFIHACGSNDMFVIAGSGGRRLRIPMICLIIAAAALAGVPPLSGFYSKEAILAALAAHPNPFWLAAGLLGIFLTAYYTFRLIFVILSPRAAASQAHVSADEASGAAAAGHHDHAAEYRLMGGPLIVLALITVLLGFGQHGLERFLGTGGHGVDPAAWLLITALVLTAAGIGLAWVEFGRRSSRQEGFVERSVGLKALFGQRWYLDHIYRWLLDVVVYRGFSAVCTRNDQQVIDGAIDGFSLRTVASGRLVSAVHSGMIQYRLLIMFAVVVLLALYFFL